MNFHGELNIREMLIFPSHLVKRRSGLSKRSHRSTLLSATSQQLGKQLNGIRRQGKRGKKKEAIAHWKSGRRSARRRRASGGIVDSCQMLIKAKERKTLVSPAKGVASQEMAGLSAPPHRLPPPPPPPPPSAAAVDIPARACARIFILRELRRLYNLPAVRRYEVAYARIAITTRLALGHRFVDCLAPVWRRVGLEKKGRSKKAGQEHRGATASRKSMLRAAVLFRPPAKQNWAKRPYDDGRNVEDDDYEASRTCNPFNVATLT